MLKIFKLFAILALAQLIMALVSFSLFHMAGAVSTLILFNLAFFSASFYGSHLLMGQIRGRMTSSSTHLEDFLMLGAISRQYGVTPPVLYIYDSNQINGYLVKGLFNSSVLAISSECFSSLGLEERGLLYRYQVMRLRFPLHLYVDTSVSILLLFHVWPINCLFLPINAVRKRFFAMEKDHLQQTLKLISLPLLNLCKNIILGVEKHSYLRPVLISSIHQKSFMSIYFRAQQSFFEKSLEYDFLSCNGFMGFDNDLFNASTESQEFKDYIWLEN